MPVPVIGIVVCTLGAVTIFLATLRIGKKES